MSSNDSAAVAAYVADYECLIEGIAYFAELEQEAAKTFDFAAIRHHYEQHPEDILCNIFRPGTRDSVSCRKADMDAIRRMALRLVAEAPNGYDLSAERIAEIICENILQVAIDQITNDEELVRILKSYVALSEAEHVEASYDFPCILYHCRPARPDFPPPPPDHFALGPVMFRSFPVFIEYFTHAVETGQKRAQEESLEIFSKTAENYGWVASVTIPRCAPDVSRKRAEEVIETAINLLKVFIGLAYSRSMRVPHTAPSRNRETCVLTEVGNTVEWRWHGRGLEGALLAGDPLDAMPACVRTFAANLLSSAKLGNRDEVTNRLLDALRWFGDASFEEAGGAQIVKWIAALERLTATERLMSGMTHRFSKRVALLASGLGTGKVEDAYRDAQKAYDLRSDVMHGARSQNDPHLLVNTELVHDLTRQAILGALPVHHYLATVMSDGRVESMARFFEKAALPHADLFNRLKHEFSSKKQQKASIAPPP